MEWPSVALSVGTICLVVGSAIAAFSWWRRRDLNKTVFQLGGCLAVFGAVVVIISLVVMLVILGFRWVT